MAQLVVQPNRRAARRQAEHERWLFSNGVGEPSRQRAGGDPVVREDGEAQMPLG